MSILKTINNYLFNVKVNHNVSNNQTKVNNPMKVKNTIINYESDHFYCDSMFRTILVLTDFYGDVLDSNIFKDCLDKNIKIEIKVKYNILDKRRAKFVIQSTEKKINNANSSYNNDDVFNDLSINTLGNIQEDLTAIKESIGTNKLVEFIYLVSIESNDYDQLQADSKEVINIGEDNGIILTPCLYNQENALNEFNDNQIKMKKYFKKLVDKDFIKLLPTRDKKEVINNDDIWIGQTQNSKQFLTIPFLSSSNLNSHTLLLGNTRFGKSTLLKTLILQARIKGFNIVLVDPQGEYKDLAIKLFGDIKKIGFNQSFKLLNGGMSDDDKESYISILSDYLVGLNKNENLRNKINSCLYELLNNSNPTLDLFFNLISAKDKEDGLNNNLVDAIAPLFKGKLGSMLTGNQELNITNKLTVFDFSELQTDDINDKFKSMFLSLFTLVISKSLHNKSNKTLFIIDEAYQLLDDPNSREFLIKTIKKIGKMNTSVILSLQDLNASSNDDFSKTLYNLCNYKMIFRQDDTSYLLPYLNREHLQDINAFNQGQYLFINQNSKTLVQTINPELMTGIKGLITY